MKKLILPLYRPLLFCMELIVIISLISFQKAETVTPCADKSHPASSYSSEVLEKWMEIQIRLMSTTVATFNGPFVRVYAYSGIAAYLSVHPGISEGSSNYFSSGQLNNIPALPEIEKGKKYHWPSSANAALADMNRLMFPLTSAANRAAIDSLEKALITVFGRDTDSATINLSAAFGKAVAQRVFSWAETDGYRHSSAPYTPPNGPGTWVPTAPSFAKPVTPYWGNLRTIVTGSIENTQPPPPPSYSEDTASDFHKMVKQVYDVSQSLTPEQRSIGLFWKDINPGVTAPGHWLNILRQVLRLEKTQLDKGSFAYALTGMALNDAWISSWKTRYTYNVLRPITYIRDVMGHKDWLPLLGTPPHPEYPSGFATMAAAVSEGLTVVFGHDYLIVDHTYDYLGMTPRSFSSFRAMAKEAGNSKFYGGIHYQLSVDIGLQQGKEVMQNIVAGLLQKRKSVKP